MNKILALAFMAAPAALVPSCTTPAGDACNAYCECEHCNDVADNATCRLWALQEEYGEIYGCEDEFDAYATCYVEEGECDERKANYTTRGIEQEGSCTGSFDTGTPCTTDTECQGNFGNNAVCQTTCRYAVCNDGSQIPCSSNDECPTTQGEDRCADEAQDYQECLANASDDPTIIIGDLD